MGATIAGEQAIQALRSFEAAGISSEDLGARLGLSTGSLAAPGSRLPRILYDELFLAAAEIKRDVLFGLRAGMAKAHADLLFFFSLSQATVGEAFREWVRLCRTVDDAMVAQFVEGDPARLRITKSGATNAEARRHQAEHLAGAMIQYLTLATGGSLRVAGIRFPHAPAGPVAEYEKILGVPVGFRHDAFELQLRACDLHTPVVTANPDMLRLMRETAEQQLRAVESQRLRERVELALRRRISDAADHSREGIAELLSMSVSTLQRRLREERCSFRDVRDQVRRKLAESLLAEGQQNVSEIAALLDFADVAAFGKAFRRWTGTNPREFRGRAGRN